ncbi:MAG: hypothetical protein NTU59_01250 [Coprothermobacterota bacterium]|nr:hypothetical protein [Coprothermobacterota bacterium]
MSEAKGASLPPRHAERPFCYPEQGEGLSSNAMKESCSCGHCHVEQDEGLSSNKVKKTCRGGICHIERSEGLSSSEAKDLDYGFLHEKTNGQTLQRGAYP